MALTLPPATSAKANDDLSILIAARPMHQAIVLASRHLHDKLAFKVPHCQSDSGGRAPATITVNQNGRTRSLRSLSLPANSAKPAGTLPPKLCALLVAGGSAFGPLIL